MKKPSANFMMLKLIEQNKDVIQNPIIKSFLDKKENYKLVSNAISYPSEKNKNAVDKAFKEHYKQIKKMAYISNLIHFFSIDYDKKIRKLNNRYTLILDKEITDNKDTTFKDLVVSKPLYTQNIFGNNLKDHIENIELYEALKLLTEKQLSILEMKFLKNMTTKEIAETTETTPQNISNQFNKSIRKLKKLLIKKEWKRLNDMKANCREAEEILRMFDRKIKKSLKNTNYQNKKI